VIWRRLESYGGGSVLGGFCTFFLFGWCGEFSCVGTFLFFGALGGVGWEVFVGSWVFFFWGFFFWLFVVVLSNSFCLVCWGGGGCLCFLGGCHSPLPLAAFPLQPAGCYSFANQDRQRLLFASKYPFSQTVLSSRPPPLDGTFLSSLSIAAKSFYSKRR